MFFMKRHSRTVQSGGCAVVAHRSYNDFARSTHGFVKLEFNREDRFVSLEEVLLKVSVLIERSLDAKATPIVIDEAGERAAGSGCCFRVFKSQRRGANEGGSVFAIEKKAIVFSGIGSFPFG